MIGFVSAALALTCCSNSKQISISDFDEYAREEQLTDSVMHSLQQQNDLVLAYATENNAWAKSATYQIIAKNHDGNWMGYFYYVNNTPGVVRSGGSNFNINPAVVSNSACDSVWQFFQQQQVWKIKGDEGKNFCASPNNNCTINDGQTMRLLIITKTKITDASFYEPVFFENCCPGKADRKLFLEAGEKIRAMVATHGSR